MLLMAGNLPWVRVSLTQCKIISSIQTVSSRQCYRIWDLKKIDLQHIYLVILYIRTTERDHSDFTFGERYLHLPAWETFIVQTGNCIKTLFHSPEFHQGHVFLVRLLKNVHPFYFTELLKDVTQGTLLANFTFYWRDVYCMRWRIDSYGPLCCESK